MFFFFGLRFTSETHLLALNMSPKAYLWVNYICEGNYVISFAVSIVRTTNLNKAVLDQRYFIGCGWVTDESEDFLPAVA